MRDGPAAALDALSAAVGAQPGRADLWSELATALVAAGRAPEAWDAAARAVELAPQSAASHRAIGSVAAALGDTAQAEAAHRHAALLDAGGAPDPGGGRHASAGADTLAAWMANQVTGRAPETGSPAPQANGSRHAAPDDTSSGRHGFPEPPTGGRRRTPESPLVPEPTSGRRRASEDAPPPATWSGSAPDGGPALQPSRGRRRAPDDGPSTATWPAGTTPGADSGRSTAVWPAGAPGPDGGPAPESSGRRRAPEDGPPTATWPAGTGPAPDGGLAGAVSPAGAPAGGGAAWPVEEVRPETAVGLPGWLGPSGPGARAVPAGATRVADPAAWRRGLITVVRIEWLAGIACFLGLAYARTAPYTAGLLAGALVVLGAYFRVRWRSLARLRPPAPDRIPSYAALAAVATAIVIIPAAMAGALTLARLAAVAAVTSATVAAVLLARLVERDVTT
jgi:hypothetical protein